MSSVRFNVDGKEFVMPSLETLTVSEFVSIQKNMQDESYTDEDLVCDLTNIDKSLIDKLPAIEAEKLFILARNVFAQPVSSMGVNFPVLPLGVYPYGVYSDFKKQHIDIHSGSITFMPYAIALLKVGASYSSRMSYWLEWANSLPASAGLYLYSKIMQEWETLCNQFEALKGDEPTELELKAGIEHLSKYGEYLTMVNLTGGDILKLKEISELPTSLVLTYICARKDMRTFSEELEKLRKQE